MRSQLKPLLAAVALALTGTTAALAQTTAPAAAGDEARFKAPSASSAQPQSSGTAASSSSTAATADQTTPAASPKMSGEDATAAVPAPDGRAPGVTGGSLSGNGSVSASPTGKAGVAPDAAPNGQRQRSPARIIGNGTPLNYGQGGANALGNTGGLSTGPAGTAGEINGGGGVRSGKSVIPPGPTNGSMRDDAAVDHGTHSTNQGGGDPGMGPTNGVGQ